MEPDELVRILNGRSEPHRSHIDHDQTLIYAVVNPDRIPGKVIIIGRYGADKVDKHLPGHIDAVKATDHIVVWQCDAMVSLAHQTSGDTI